jgi:VWFA-related protein
MLLPLLLLILVPLPAHAQSEAGARVAQVDTSAYPIVKLYVSVTDAAGKPQPGLTARDFSIAEDGRPVTIDEFVGGGAGSINTVLVIDRSGSMDESDKIDGAKDAAQAFVSQMRQGDQTALIAFSSEPQLVQPFTADAEQLSKAIRRLRADGSTALYDSLIAGVDQLKALSGRRALLLMTDGRDMVGTGDPQPASRATLDQAIAAATRAGISAQVIGLGDRGSDDMRGGIDEQVLRRIADETGGAYFYAPDAGQLADLYRRLSADMQQEYVITYRSPRPFYDGTRRDIRVSVGGAPSASGAYVEQHLIDVHSSPLVGVLLLLPILAAFTLPGLLRRRRPAAHRPPLRNGALPIADRSTIMPPIAASAAPDSQRCRACQAPLSPPDARFCMSCGVDQASAAAPARPELAEERRIFCDQCGRPLRAGARFCSTCGATTPIAGTMLEIRD